MGKLNGVATVEDSIEVPQKVEHSITIQSSNSTSGYTFKRIKHKNLNTLFTVLKWWKQPKGPSVDEEMSKMWSIYTVKY